MKKLLIAAAVISLVPLISTGCGEAAVPENEVQEQNDGQKAEDAVKYNEKGMQYLQQADYAKALEHFEKALAIQLKVLGENHPDTATSYYNIGFVYDRQGNYAKALEYYEKALAICLQVLGENHPSTAISYYNIGGILFASGKKEESLNYLRKALAIYRKTLGDNHSQTKQVMQFVKFIESQLGK